MSQPPPLRRRSMPVWLRLLLVLGLMIGLLGGTVIGFNAYAAAKLRAAIADYEADGETLDFRSLLPEPVPDDQNFCAIPELANLADPELGKANRERIDGLDPSADVFRKNGTPPAYEISALSGNQQDFFPWAQWLNGSNPVTDKNSTATVVAGLLPRQDLLKKLSVGLDRPYSEWLPALVDRELPDDLAAIQVPHIHSANQYIRYQSVAARALLNSGDPKAALASVLVQMRMIEACIGEPFVFANYVGHDCILRCASVVWDMCREGKMSAEESRELCDALSRLDINQAYLRALKCELIGIYQTALMLKFHEDPWDVLTPIKPAGFMDRHRAIRRLVSKAIPDGVFDLNTASLVELYNRYVISPARDMGPTAAIKEAHELNRLLRFAVEKHQWDRVIAAFCLGGNFNTHSVRKAEIALGVMGLATTACRLEAHFAEHGGYPQSLADLPPDMRYERTATRYRLWLPGPDGEDDGGTRILDPEKPEKTKFHADEYQGDWVWDYPEG